MVRPQKKQQQKRMQMMDQLKKGDKVILVDGLHGKVDSINDQDKTVVIDADGIYLTFSRLAIRQVLPAAAEVTKSAKVEDKAEEKKDEKPAAPAKEEASEKATEPASEDKADQTEDK